MPKQSKFIVLFSTWAATQENILGVLLVGSQAHGTAREDSDVDLVIITNKPAMYLQQDKWLDSFGKVIKSENENFGLVQSKRIHFDNGLEVEFGITTLDWLRTNPIDAGTKRVMQDGYRILYDKIGAIASCGKALMK